MEDEIRYTLDAGAFVRGAAKREIEAYCFRNRISCTIEEMKGMFESKLLVTIKGSRDRIKQAEKDIDRWIKQNN